MNREKISWNYEKRYLKQDYLESEEAAKERIEKMLWFLDRHPELVDRKT